MLEKNKAGKTETVQDKQEKKSLMIKNRRIDNKDLIACYLHKMLSSIPDFETVEELNKWLRNETAKPQEQIDAEYRNVLEEARKELENCTYLY